MPSKMVIGKALGNQMLVKSNDVPEDVTREWWSPNKKVRKWTGAVLLTETHLGTASVTIMEHNELFERHGNPVSWFFRNA